MTCSNGLRNYLTPTDRPTIMATMTRTTEQFERTQGTALTLDASRPCAGSEAQNKRIPGLDTVESFSGIHPQYRW